MAERASSPRDYGLVTLRHVQWLFAVLSYFLFVSVFSNARTRLGLDDRVRAVPWMNIATFIYASLVLLGVYAANKLSMASRFVLECLSIGWDLCAAGVFVAKGALLNSTRLDCQVLLEEKFFDRDVTRQTLKSFKTALGFGGRFGIDDIDRQCAASLIIYWLSIIAIILYSFSVLLTCLRIREYRGLLLKSKKLESPGHVELTIEAHGQTLASRVSSTSSFRSPAFPSPRGRSQERLVAQDFAVPITYRSRTSQETTSSYNAEIFLVSDGFRPSEEPPVYASRPASLYSVKGD